MCIDCVLFDHDDTLIPTFPMRARAWECAVREVLGHRIDGAAHLREHLGETIERTAIRLTDSDGPLAARLVEVYREIYFDPSNTKLAPFPGVAETLAALRAGGIRIAVVTSKIHAGALRELHACGIDGYVEQVVGSDDVAEHKPSPEPLLHALRLLGVEPARALMVGDTTLDLLAARAAGTRGAAALWGAQEAQALLALQPDCALVDVRDMLGCVGVGAA